MSSIHEWRAAPSTTCLVSSPSRANAAGERLLQTVARRLGEIEAGLAALTALRDKPAGSIRITAADFASDTILLPRLAPFLPRYPDIRIEVSIDDRLVDSVAERFDAGVRDGELVAKDMIAVRIGPDLCMAVVGAPSWFSLLLDARRHRG